MMEVSGSIKKIHKKVHKKNTYSVRTIEKVTVKPNEQTIITCRLDTGKEELPPGTLCGILDPAVAFENRTDLCVTSALVKVDEEGRIPVGLINVSGSEVKLHVKTMIGKLKILSPRQIEFLTMIDPRVLEIAKRYSGGDKKELDKILTALYAMDEDEKPQALSTQWDQTRRWSKDENSGLQPQRHATTQVSSQASKRKFTRQSKDSRLWRN